MKKFAKIFVLPALVLCAVLGLTACNNNEDPVAVKRIDLTQNVKTDYLLNEEFDAMNSKLVVTLNNGNTTEISITSDMIKNFDTTTVGEKHLTIKYETKSLNLSYRVDSFVMGKFVCKRDLLHYNDGTPDVEIPGHATFGTWEFAKNGQFVMTLIGADEVNLPVISRWTYERNNIIKFLDMDNDLFNDNEVTITVINTTTIQLIAIPKDKQSNIDYLMSLYELEK